MHMNLRAYQGYDSGYHYSFNRKTTYIYYIYGFFPLSKSPLFHLINRHVMRLRFTGCLELG